MLMSGASDDLKALSVHADGTLLGRGGIMLDDNKGMEDSRSKDRTGRAALK